MSTTTQTTTPCGDTTSTAIGTITCDLPADHDGPHAGGDRTYWAERGTVQGPTVQLCHPDDVAAASRAYGLPVVSDDGYTHAAECHWCRGEANNDTCPRSVHLREYVAGFRGVDGAVAS